MSVKEMKYTKRAFVLVDVVPGKEEKIMEKLLEYDGVVEAHVIGGEYDVLAVLEMPARYLASVQEQVQELVKRIRHLTAVKDTSTIIPFSSVSKRVE